MLSGCSDGGDSASGSSPALITTPAANHNGGEAAQTLLDAVAPDTAGDYDESERELLSLLVGPAQVGNSYRLLSVTVDDPNGTGRIDDRWYPPRLRTEDCRVSVDTAPIPTAVASFIPGDPSDLWSKDDSFNAVEQAMKASHQLGIQLQLFDNASQRDAAADVMDDFYRALPGLECSTTGPLTSLGGMLGTETVEVDAYDTGYPAVAFHATSMFGDAVTAQYEVGDSALLTVSVAHSELAGADGPEPSIELATTAIDAQISVLRDNGLG